MREVTENRNTRAKNGTDTRESQNMNTTDGDKRIITHISTAQLKCSRNIQPCLDTSVYIVLPYHLLVLL
jgi:hypothetical protein